MNILLVYTNRYRYLTPPPLGLTYLVGPLERAGHAVRLLDCMFLDDPAGALERELAEFRPRLVGFSVRNLDSQSMLDVKSPLDEIRPWVGMAKDKGAVTVLGGTAFTTQPRAMLEFMQADYGICGQGEDSLPALAAAVETGADVSAIPGIVYREGDRVIVSPAVIKGYPAGVHSDWSRVDFDAYRRRALLTPPASVAVKTGCAFRCSFCDARASIGEQVILRDPDDIIDEIRRIRAQHRTRWFFLTDTNFNVPLEPAKALLERIIQADVRIRFLTRLDPVRGAFDREFFRLFVRAGGYSAQVGFHSFSQTMLDAYQAPFSLDDIEAFGRMANQAGVRFGAELLFGGPGETHDTIRESMAFLPRIRYAFVNYSIGVRISPRAPMYERAVREGQVGAGEELLAPRFYLSRDVDAAWVKGYIDQSLKRYSYRQAAMIPILFRNVLERARR